MIEQVVIQVALDPIGGGGGWAVGNQVIHLENYVDGLLPNPIYITRIVIWYDGATALTSATQGNLAFAVDPGSNYIRRGGFPTHQYEEPQYIKSLGILELLPNGSRQKATDFNPPIAYRSGDAILSAPEIIGGGTVAGAFLTVFFQATGDISDPPIPPPYQLLRTTLNFASGNNPASCVRSYVPGPGLAATMVRVRVISIEGQATVSNIAHMSVGLQSGATPNTISAPVELKFNGHSGISLYQSQWAWSDWTPLAVPAGQSLLVTASMIQLGNTNFWSLQTVGGIGAWASAVDSWNSATLLGTVTVQPTWTQVIDQVQVM